ncbi:hypothetical protein AB0N73_01485 [Microbacterium sp. NPDC089189]|uniref:hypothetical protein n=1 Tax=Microbacterium sp. NPDC089189 TaxID=3154972 RepID=UPI00344012A8
MTTIAHARPSSAGRLVPLGIDRWRVLTPDGAVAGLVSARIDPDGTRYLAQRYRWSSHAFVDVGEFWRLDDAAAVLRAA